MKRASGPTFSPTAVRNAMTSCLTWFSISATRAASKSAFFRMTASASFGIAPSSASASQAASSTCSQQRSLCSSSQICAISGRE
jgi:hypothetical protein